jgi:hypothetical protein
MQPFISQALLATRTAEMDREAQIAQRARDLKRARRRAQPAPDAGAADTMTEPPAAPTHPAPLLPHRPLLREPPRRPDRRPTQH